MHGNVYEWCADNWHTDYQGAPEDGSVWEGGDASIGVVRGGSWIAAPEAARSASRGFGLIPDDRLDGLGFRVARMLSH